MRRFNAKVFDDNVSFGPQATTGLATTSSRYDAVLGQFDNLVVQAVVDNVDTAGTMFVFQYHSSDGKTWHYKNGLITLPLTVGSSISGVGMDLSGVPALAFVRLNLQLAVGGTTRAWARLYVTARDTGA